MRKTELETSSEKTLNLENDTEGRLLLGWPAGSAAGWPLVLIHSRVQAASPVSSSFASVMGAWSALWFCTQTGEKFWYWRLGKDWGLHYSEVACGFETPWLIIQCFPCCSFSWLCGYLPSFRGTFKRCSLSCRMLEMGHPAARSLMLPRSYILKIIEAAFLAGVNHHQINRCYLRTQSIVLTCRWFCLLFCSLRHV